MRPLRALLGQVLVYLVHGQRAADGRERHRVIGVQDLRDLERDLQDEIAFHVGMREAQLRASGAADARAGARRTFGGAAKIRKELYDTWALAPRLGGLAKDVAYAARMLRRHRGFATVVVLTLGFGIGVNTATFSIVNAVLIRPLGFAEPERLVMLHERLAGSTWTGRPSDLRTSSMSSAISSRSRAWRRI